MKKETEESMLILRYPPLLIEHAFLRYAKIHGWEIAENVKGQFTLKTASKDVFSSFIAVKAHMPNYLDPMVRYYFTNSEPMLAEAKRIIGMNDDTKFICNPLDLSMKTTEYEERARNELGELFPEDAIWSKAKFEMRG